MEGYGRGALFLRVSSSTDRYASRPTGWRRSCGNVYLSVGIEKYEAESNSTFHFSVKTSNFRR